MDTLAKNQPPDKRGQESSAEAQRVEELSFPDVDEEQRSFVDLEAYEKQYGDPKEIDIGPSIWHSVWSKYFIELCDWGCGHVSYLHARNGRVYYQDDE